MPMGSASGLGGRSCPFGTLHGTWMAPGWEAEPPFRGTSVAGGMDQQEPQSVQMQSPGFADPTPVTVQPEQLNGEPFG